MSKSIKKLSILIVTLDSRQEMFQTLKNNLHAQITPEVEVLISKDNGESSIGAKRNSLLKTANGEYISFIDDDDNVSITYVVKILDAIKNKPDCVGIEGIITLNDIGPRKFIHSLKYKNWFEEGEVYYRFPNHLNPIKREIALKVGFPDISNQEDKAYSYNIQGLLKTETYIDEPIYFYYPSSERV